MAEKADEESKKKFVFNCTKCGRCCKDRGPIPIIMEDLTLWARNNVVQNIIPYLTFYKPPSGGIDLVLTRVERDPAKIMKKGTDDKEVQDKAPEDRSCPLYNDEKKLCTIFDNRPMSCRTYPLEFDGAKYSVIDAELCPGIGNGEMTKEDRALMRDQAKAMNLGLTQMRIVMPILSQAYQPFFLQELMEMQQKFMEELEKMPPEQRKMYEEQMKRG